MRGRGTDIISATRKAPAGKGAANEANHQGKRRFGSASWRQEPLAADPRDPDIVRAHQIARRAQPYRRARPRPARESR